MTGSGDQIGTQGNLLLEMFAVGDRIELHPGLDRWIAGDRFGTVTAIGRFYLTVHLDRSGKTGKISPENVDKVTPTG